MNEARSHYLSKVAKHIEGLMHGCNEDVSRCRTCSEYTCSVVIGEGWSGRAEQSLGPVESVVGPWI